MRRSLAAVILAVSAIFISSSAQAKTKPWYDNIKIEYVQSKNVPTGCQDPNGHYRCGGGDFRGRNWGWGEPQQAVKIKSERRVRKAARLKKAERQVSRVQDSPNILHRYAPRAAGGGADESCLPFQIQAALANARAMCGPVTVISAFRPGARVRGSGHVSDHASCRAADVRGNYPCIYRSLASFPGQVSKDWARVAHIHFGMSSWGKQVRFNHYGGSRKYARRHYRHRREASAS